MLQKHGNIFQRLLQYLSCSLICFGVGLLILNLELISMLMLNISILTLTFYSFDIAEQIFHDYTKRLENTNYSMFFSLSTGLIRMFLSIIFFLVMVLLDRDHLLYNTCCLLFFYLFSTLSSITQIIKKEGKYKS